MAGLPSATPAPDLPARFVAEEPADAENTEIRYANYKEQKMKIEAVKFVQRSDGQYWLLIKGRWVMKNTFLNTYAAVIKNWSNIDWYVRQTAKTMVGKAQWGAPAERGLIQAMGRCIRFFVDHDMLPELLAIARKRNGDPYKGGRRLYVLASALQIVARPAVSSKAPKHVGALDPRTIRIDPKLCSPAITA